MSRLCSVKCSTITNYKPTMLNIIIICNIVMSNMFWENCNTVTPAATTTVRKSHRLTEFSSGHGVNICSPSGAGTSIISSRNSEESRVSAGERRHNIHVSYQLAQTLSAFGIQSCKGRIKARSLPASRLVRLLCVCVCVLWLCPVCALLPPLSSRPSHLKEI